MDCVIHTNTRVHVALVLRFFRPFIDMEMLHLIAKHSL